MVKAILRRLLLLPLQPHVMGAQIRALRILGLLPQRIPGEWPPRRILIVNMTGNLGDAVMMLPTVDALHRVLPHADIDLVAESPMDIPLRAAPALRTVFCFKSRKSAIPLLSHYLRAHGIFRFVRRNLMEQPYDLALLPRWGTDPSLSPYVAAMSSAPRRCGHDPTEEPASQDIFPGMATLLTDVSHGGLGMAEGVREQLVLVACGLTGTLDAKVEERRPVETVLAMSDSVDIESSMRRLGVTPNQPFVLLAPGASHPARRWPPERFALLGAALRNNLNIPVFSIGGPVDQELGKHIEQISKGLVRTLAGKTSVLEGIALTRRASLLVTNDSGPAHIGGSVGVPTLVLSVCPRTSIQEHANSPRRVRPVGPRVIVMQPDENASGCSDRCLAAEPHCILGLTTDSVVAQAIRMTMQKE